MRRLLCVFLCAALLVLPSCGNTPSAPPGSASQSGDAHSAQQVMDIPFSLAVYPAYSLHPTLTENRANLTLAPLLYEPLFQLNEQFQAVGVLCQSYAVSEDKLSWTFTLRSGVTFSDGSPLTGQAVADALNIARQAPSRYARRLADVIAVTGEGDTLTLALSRPNGALPLLLDIPIAAGVGDRPPGTGPYALSDRDNVLSLQARATWWQQLPVPAETIFLTAAAKPEDLVAAFDAGDIWMLDVDLMGTNALGYSGSYETWDYSTTDLLYLGFNVQSGPCRSAELRQALARAINRGAIVQADYARHAAASTLPVHPASPVYDDSLALSLSYTPEALVSAVESLDAKNRSLVLLVNSENSAKSGAARRIAAELEAAGLSVTLSKLPFEDYVTALQRGDFDLYLGEVVLTADFDLSTLLGAGGALNYGGWRDSQWDALLAALRSADGQERTDAFGALLAYFNEQAPIAPICFKNNSILTQWGRLSGLSPVRGNAFYHLESWQLQ